MKNNESEIKLIPAIKAGMTLDDLTTELRKRKRTYLAHRFDKLFESIMSTATGRFDEDDLIELRNLIYGKKKAQQQVQNQQELASQLPNYLTYDQKLHIYEEENVTPAKELAIKYKVNEQQIRRAQRGEFNRQKQRPRHDTSNYGPLTLEQKRHIRDHRANEPAAELAREYQTNYGNIKVAQQGKFKDTQPINYRSIISNIPEEILKSYIQEKYNVEI